jgi:hypothetical protein
MKPLSVEILSYQAQNHVITTNIESNFHQMMLETTNIHQKEVKILTEVGKTRSSNSYFQRRTCDFRSVVMTK